MIDDDKPAFTEILAEHGHGTINQQAGEQMQALVRAAIKYRGKGKQILTTEVQSKDGETVEVKITVKTTEPRPGGVTFTYFATSEGDLVDENPRQTKIPAKILRPTPIRPGDGGAS